MVNSNYGETIFTKFDMNGSAIRYPGNTIISEVDYKSKEFIPIRGFIDQLKKIDLVHNLIWLPPSSYHVTIISGVNDQVREPAHWSTFKSLDTPLKVMDHFFIERFQNVRCFEKAPMVMDSIRLDNQDLRVILRPADDAVNKLLRLFRNEVSEKFGVRHPNHETYQFHITLAYMWEIPDEDRRRKLDETLAAMNNYLKEIDQKIILGKPKLTFYEDMTHFPTERLRIE